MKTITINKNESNIRIDKYISKLLPNCNKSLFYKLLRKKYFKINDRVAKGDELLNTGDIISIFLADETYDKFSKIENDKNVNVLFNFEEVKNRIIYEDDNIIVFNKNENELSQKDTIDSYSVNELLNDYLKFTSFNFSSTYKPSIINRLDRNTKGLIIFSKTYLAVNILSKFIKNQLIDKYYFTYVNGILKKKEDILYGLYSKDEVLNKASVKNISLDEYEKLKKDSNNKDLVILEYEVLKEFNYYTSVNIKLITGKSHQIRVQFSSINHPLICDKKYMSDYDYKVNKNRFKRTNQDLICYKIHFPINDELSNIGLSDKTIQIEYGDINKYEKV